MGPPPVVTGISPKEGPPGTRVTIRGEFLGTSATDLIGLKICGCDCLLSAEWKSKNKIVARSGPCKGRGDIIVTTRFGGEGTSTVQFRGYHESIGPVKESAVWVEEAAPPSLPWGRRPMSPTTYTPPDPLGLSTEGDDCKFPEEELNEMFPDGSGKLSDDNFQPGWYLLEYHSNTSYEDLKAGMLSFLKANTGAVMDQLDRLVLLKNMYEEDERKNGKEPLPSLQAAIEESITLADSLFSEILSRKDNADKTREALSLLTRHKFLFQLPASIDRNIRKKEYDLVVNDYTRVKNLFGNTDVKLFQKILAEIDKKIEDLKEKLYTRMKTMPINVQEQTKYISLNWEGDAAWVAITSRKEYLMSLMNKVKDHFKQKEELEANEKGNDNSSSGVIFRAHASLPAVSGRRQPHLLETYLNEAFAAIHKCVVTSGRRESPLLADNSEPAAILQKHIQQILLAYVTVLQDLALNHEDQVNYCDSLLRYVTSKFSLTIKSKLLSKRAEEGAGAGAGAQGAQPAAWQLRLLLAGANAAYTRRHTLAAIATAIHNFGFPKQTQALQATKEALSTLESTIAETYLEHKGDPLVGTIEPSMDMGRHKTDADAIVDDARPYVDSVSGAASSRYVRDICETVCEELARLAALGTPGAPMSPAAAFQARLEYTLLRLACAEHLTRKAESFKSYLSLFHRRMDTIVQGFKKRMELQLASLNCNMETV
ncbi:hypothetical protein HF086_011347 [Spodoptera exigua]|uniref:Exocyst complex component 2 n=1 Tax=Spodoptera exigua TaxID=7107 RepID=A0A922MVU0_SPOEX|nr:hypothetical protein HF086_011347 [Spodoptera exigua]